jgi:hypothetical protein
LAASFISRQDCRLLAFSTACPKPANVRIGSISTELGLPRHVRFTLDSDRIADIPERQFRANNGSWSLSINTDRRLRSFDKALVPMVRRSCLTFNVVLPMDNISWSDLNQTEQYAIAVTGAGLSSELCDATAVLILERLGLIRGSRLTPKAEQLRKVALLSKVE